MKKFVLLVWLLCLTLSGIAIPPPPPPIEGLKPLHPLNYKSTQEFRQAWKTVKPITAGSLIKMNNQTVVKLPCAFETKEITDRAWWDLDVKTDLRNSSAVAMDLYVENPEGINQMTIYLSSKDGSRYCGYNIEIARLIKGKWNRMYLPLASFNHLIDLKDAAVMRISPWKSRSRKTVIYLANLCYDERPQKVIVLNKDTTPYLTNLADKMIYPLAKLGIPYKSITAEKINPEDLKGGELVIVPFYPKMTNEMAKVLANFIENGGKVIVAHHLHPILGKAIGATQARFPAGFEDQNELRNNLKYMLFEQPPAWVPQNVINVFGRPSYLKATDKDAKVLARWRYSNGSDAQLAAIINSPRGAVLSHGFNWNRDREGQGRLYLYLIATYAPGMQKELAEKRLDELDSALGMSDWKSSLTLVKKQDGFNSDSWKLASEADRLRTVAHKAFGSGDYMHSIEAALDANNKITDAFFRAQKPLSGERRWAVFQHADGLSGDSWDESIRVVKAGGFTDVAVNLQGSGGVAYPSEYAPYYVSWHSPRVQDNLTLCLEACRKYGIKLHVWITNMRLLYCPPEWREKLEKAGRLQIAMNGKSINWLCPTHPENIKLQGDLMVEAAKRGAAVNYDYIRYEFQEGCYCGRCRELFEKRIGRKVDWPKDVYGKKAPLHTDFLRFREDNITRIVHETSRRIREVSPEIEISAAVGSYPQCIENMSQDWMKWVKAGDIDFIFPMIYTADMEMVRENTIENVKNYSMIPFYTALGSYRLSPVEIVKQIGILRKAGGKGFQLFSMASDGEAYLSALAKGLTSDLAEKNVTKTNNEVSGSAIETARP